MRTDRRQRQRGYTLPESLIAAVIAAGVVAAAAQSIGASVRLSAAAKREDARLLEARTIIERVKAGMDDDDALEGFDDWRLERAPVPPARSSEPPVFDEVTLSIEGKRPWPLKFWAPVLDQGSTQ